MPHYAVLIYADDSAHALDATPEDLAAADQHADALVSSGALLTAYAFTPRDMAVSIRADSVTPGPIVGGPLVVAGVYVIEAHDLDEALSIARTNPVLSSGGGVEVRPIHSGGVIRDEVPSP